MYDLNDQGHFSRVLCSQKQYCHELGKNVIIVTGSLVSNINTVVISQFLHPAFFYSAWFSQRDLRGHPLNRN